MTRRRTSVAPALAALAALAAAYALPATAGAYRAGPPAGHTGGFGEPTCAACHWSEEAEAGPAGGLTVRAPDAYRPGETYDVRVALEDPAMTVAGFQLSARFEDGGSAGTLAAADSCVRVFTSGAGVAYASHTEAGTVPREAGRAEWTVRWTAPEAGGAVVFHAAGNAANDDASEFGDRIHAAEARSPRRDPRASRGPGSFD